MTSPALELHTGAPADANADAVVLVVAGLTDTPEDLSPFSSTHAALTAVGFTGKAGAYTRIPAPDVADVPVAVVSAGSAPDAHAVREAVGGALRTLTGFDRVSVLLGDAVAEHAPAAAEGALLGGYRFDDYRSGDQPKRAGTVVLHAELAAEDAAHAAALAEAVALTRDLVTTPAEWLGPEDLAQRAVEELTGLEVTVDVLDETALAAGGYGGILGVGQGSDRPPRLVRLDYSPAGATGHIALVGKGITFDTGGLSLKPPAGMVGMKTDMAGAASILAATKAVAALGLPIRVTAWLCIADNMPSGSAIRPGDVLRFADGQTVEVLNTDAEGRLVLADGLVAASRENPDVILDVATLTGAIIVALGMRHTGVFGDDDTVQEVLAAASATGELAWPMPLPEHMEDELKSPIADMVNAKIGDPAGGSLFAGLFLRRMVGRTSDEADAPRIPWAHLDIAGSSEHKGAPYGFTDKGATGAIVRTLIAFAEARANGADA
ncbi:MAG: leucyl aminopeptidase [Microbacterium sp. 14-71-5]|uniref:leucyl aminopeptidase n=1 Tax=Microbacterium sp. 13-71-7 TaxID=1970399 RepID=UPI000BC8B293|nr:leucyl aminopeptidase [Microbacterium sp. 13-71-7]OZB82873.1 MAG: leucyl aminopeptidase [Microbacterium sp. 13-71-7]OZB88259.1 MAG: leucyl aminopeptidase [Microbacterium sp. 14-71-5]